MLDRIGDEIARATSIVRYAPNSRFSPHTHGGGEEFLVLDGVFEDEHGRYPAGSYVRNPPGSAHAPRAGEGCIIFVRLRQFGADDRRAVVDLQPPRRRDRSLFMPRSLFDGPDEHVAIMRWAPHAGIEFAAHGGLELLMLEGQLSSGAECLAHWSWLRLPPGTPLAAAAGSAGCTTWVKTAALWPGTPRPGPHFAGLNTTSDLDQEPNV
jgi:anti-sigma factor ChrR (cupin superfamily)